MSDYEGDLAFDEPEGDDGSDGGGGGTGGTGGTGGCCRACMCMLVGLALYPGALYFSGWNEQRTVCRRKALFKAEDNSIQLSCSSATAKNGDSVKPDDLGFLSCALDENTLTHYSNKDIPGLEEMLPGLFNAPGLGLQVKTEMVVCKEKCTQSECRGRQLAEGELNDTGTSDSFPEIEAETSTESPTNSVSARRLRRNGGSGRRRRSCKKECLQWGYWLDWSDELGSSDFRNTTGAQQACGGLNPHGPISPALGISTKYANSSQVKVQGGGWALNGKQTQAIPIDVPVNLTATMNELPPLMNGELPPAITEGWSENNTMVIGNQLHTCNIKEATDIRAGCMRLSAKVSYPENVALLGKVSASQKPGLISEEGWEAPADWLCGGQTVYRVCPTSGIFEGCGVIRTKEELFEVMHGENNMISWIYRLTGFLLTWLGICFICQPLTTIVQMAGNCLDQITACIPGLGCIVDEITDVFTGLVKAVVCLISCMCAASSFIFVAGVMWMVMRPLVAIPLLILGFCVCGGSGYLMHKCRKKREGDTGSQKILLNDKLIVQPQEQASHVVVAT